MAEHSSVAEFYADKTIFVTGASGLIGKVLIWKLLHSCPDLNVIYVLIRPKRGKNVRHRIDELLQSPIFENFKVKNPKILDKVQAIAGDIGAQKLGLSEEDERKLEQQVHVIFHIAAILKFDANVKDAVNINTTGTLHLLQLATRMQKLQVFLHTSTAYCYCDIPIVEEKTYLVNESPYDIINLVEWMKPEVLEEITDKLIKPHPNTYTYSKRLAENVVNDYYPKIPVVIARPSIVIPAWKEPIPGWVDNFNGPTGLFIAAGKGVLRSMNCNGEYFADLIPVDVVCNGLIVIAWDMATRIEKPEKIPVYNLTQMEMEPTTWQEVVNIAKRVNAEYPFETMLWYPGGNVHSSKYIHNFIDITFHWIPAYFIDFLLLLLGRKTFLVHVHKKLHHGLKVLQYFTTRQWIFVKENIVNLKNHLSENDKHTFIMTSKGLNQEEFMLNSVLITRHYLLKENPNSISKCKRRLKMLYVLDCIMKIMFWLFVAWMLLKLINIVGVYDN